MKKIFDWEDLIKIVDERDSVSFVFKMVKAKYRPALAAALSVAKWSPSRGVNQGYGDCGLCSFYKAKGCDGVHCPLSRVFPCYDNGSPFQKWLAAKNKKNKNKYANQMYNMLVRIYTTAYNEVD